MGFKTEPIAKVHSAKICGILGKGWSGHVWENIGWHCSWQNGAVTLYYSDYLETYFCLIGGHMDLTMHENHSNPIETIKRACEHAQQVIKEQWKPIESSVAKVILSL